MDSSSSSDGGAGAGSLGDGTLSTAAAAIATAPAMSPIPLSRFSPGTSMDSIKWTRLSAGKNIYNENSKKLK